MFVLSEYVYFISSFFHIRRAISTQTNPKSGLREKKTTPYYHTCQPDVCTQKIFGFGYKNFWVWV